MLTQKEIYEVAKQQLAFDYNCEAKDFGKKEVILTHLQEKPEQRLSDSAGTIFRLVSFFGTSVFSVGEELRPWIEQILPKVSAAWVFEYQSLKAIDKHLEEKGQTIADIHEYYLPDLNRVVARKGFELKWYNREQLDMLTADERFHEAFADDPKHPDMLGIAAFIDGEVAGMAGASADSEMLWQLGVQVLPEHRNTGIATTLITELKEKVIAMGRVPYCGTAESHHVSKMIMYKAGFQPAWAELYALPEKE